MYFTPLYLWKRDHLHFDVFHWNKAWNKNRQNTAMQPRKDELQTRSAPTLKKRLGALNKLLKTQASEISPPILRELIAITCL